MTDTTAGAFFDLDGLILDSEPLQLLATNHALASIGVEISVEEWGNYVGSPTIVNLRRIVENAGADVDVHELERIKNSAYELACATQLEVRPGADRLVRSLEDKGLLLALVTSSTLADAERLTAQVGVREHFEVIISSDDVSRGKPAPDPYLAACEATGLNPRHCIAIEDSRNGVLSAVAAGLTCVAVPNRFTRQQDLTAADLIVDDFEALDAEVLRRLVFNGAGA